MSLSTLSLYADLVSLGRIVRLSLPNSTATREVDDGLGDVLLENRSIDLNTLDQARSFGQEGIHTALWNTENLELALETRGIGTGHLVCRTLELRNVGTAPLEIRRISLWRLLVGPAFAGVLHRFDGSPAQVPVCLALQDEEGGFLAGIANPFFRMSVDPGHIQIWYEPNWILAPGEIYRSDPAFLRSWQREDGICFKELGDPEPNIESEQETLNWGLVKATRDLLRELNREGPSFAQPRRDRENGSDDGDGDASDLRWQSRMVFGAEQGEKAAARAERVGVIYLNGLHTVSERVRRLDLHGHRQDSGCLACEEVVQRLKSSLMQGLRHQRAGALEWHLEGGTDASSWSPPECFDPAHGHGSGRARYRTWRNLLQLVSEIRQQYPHVHQCLGQGSAWLGPWTAGLAFQLTGESPDATRLASWYAHVYGACPREPVAVQARRSDAAEEYAILSAAAIANRLELESDSDHPASMDVAFASRWMDMVARLRESGAYWRPLFGQPMRRGGGLDGSAYGTESHWILFLFNPTDRPITGQISVQQLTPAGPDSTSWDVQTLYPEPAAEWGILLGNGQLLVPIEPRTACVIQMKRSSQPGVRQLGHELAGMARQTAFPSAAEISDRIAQHHFYFGDPPSSNSRGITRTWECPLDDQLVRYEFSEGGPRLSGLQIVVPHDHLFDEISLLEQAAAGVTAKMAIVSADVLIWEEGGSRFRKSIRELEGWYELARDKMQRLMRTIDKHSDHLVMARSAADIEQAERAGKSAVLIGFEGGKPIEGSLERLREFYELGLRQLQFTWAFRNQIADGQEEPENGGLTPFGRDVVRETNRLGILGDVTHLSRRGFFEVLELSQKPVVASHSSAFQFCPDPGNLDDEQLRALAAQGGVAGVHFCSHILRAPNSVATMEDVVDHITFMVDRMGVEHVGLGCDFLPYDEAYRTAQKLFMQETDPRGRERIDLLVFVKGLDRIGQLTRLVSRLLRRGFHDDEIRKIMGGNWLRVYREVLK